VGYAIEDMEISLLDDDGRESGFNRLGEIAVRSRYLSPGYWRRPDLSAEKFLPDPNKGDKRVYLTGDLGRMLPDGCLCHLGRKDFQVKVRGHRIEVAEIEAALLRLDTIKEAIVVGRANQTGDKRLVGYVVSVGEPRPTVTTLRHALTKQLPDYMIPSAFVMLESLPLTPNGKVDRTALPELGNSRPELDTPFVAPRTPVEQKLAQIWTEILSLDSVGVHDNFFDLGGHSLAATRVVSQVIKQFQIEVELPSLFQSPTVAEMASVIAEHEGKQLGEKELDRILTELESLSDEDARRLLIGQSRT
jgi:acyl carrier protein